MFASCFDLFMSKNDQETCVGEKINHPYLFLFVICANWLILNSLKIVALFQSFWKIRFFWGYVSMTVTLI